MVASSLVCAHQLMQLFCSPRICGQVSHNTHILELVRLSAALEMICLAERVAFSGQAASRSVQVRQDFSLSTS